MSVNNQFITFTYPAGPKDVIVTGDFCKWQKTTHLVPQSDGSFSLTMPLFYKSIKKEDDGDYFYFKFVVDDEWTIDSRYQSKVPQGATVEQPNNYVTIDENSKRLSSFIPESALPMGQNSGSSGKKRVRVKRKMKKNKKTGETSIISEDQEFVNEGSQEPDSSSIAYTSSSPTPAPQDEATTAAIVVPTTDEAKNVFTSFENTSGQKELNEKLNSEIESQPVETKPTEDVKPSLSIAGEPGVQIADPSNPVFKEFRDETPALKETSKEDKDKVVKETIEEETKFTILPVEQPKAKLDVAGEPGVQIANASNPVFAEVRDVDQKELNERLNAQLVEEEKEEASVKAAEQQIPDVVETAEPAQKVEPVKKVEPKVESAVKTEPKAPKKSDGGGCCVIC